jgi:hypothetical protein
MDKEQWLVGAGAAGVTATASIGETTIPALHYVVPLCTGACGACGGGCMAAIGAVAWISAVAFYKKHHQEAEHHE